MIMSKEKVEHIALLARLKLTEQEISLYTNQLNSILKYAAILEQIDTDNVTPTAHAVALYNVLRDDEVKLSMPQDEVLKNAPDVEDGFFRVPRIV